MLKKVPKGTRVMIFSNSVFWLASNLLTPFLSIFYISELSGVTLTEVGISALIYYLAFGVIEPLAGLVSDKYEGLKDEIFFVFGGFLARGIIFILFSFSTNVWHLYMFQFWLGAFRAISGPSYKVLFSKMMGNKISGLYWGLDESLINLSAAIGAGVGGYMVTLFGFRPMLVAAGIITIFAGLEFLVFIKKVNRHNKQLI